MAGDASAPPSTGVYRLRRAGGDQSNLRVGDSGKVPRGVQVPIQHQPAGLAAELAHPERKHRLDASAAGTPLGRGEEPGRDHQPRPIPRALVRKLPVELAPPLIADRTSKTPIADHARTCRSSTTITDLVFASVVVALWSASVRWLRMRRWHLASDRTALRRFREPGRFRLTARA